jgi:hypothetical protein
MNRPESFLYLLTGVLLLAAPMRAESLRVDINSEGRADLRTVGWQNWRPSGDLLSQSFGGVTVSLRSAGAGSSLRLRGKKSIVVHGVTLGADGALAYGPITAGTSRPTVMEVRLEGLAPGRHTFVGYHHTLDGESGPYTVSIGDRKVEGIRASKEPRYNDDVGTSFVDFEAKADQAVVIRISARSGDVVVGASAMNCYGLDRNSLLRYGLKLVFSSNSSTFLGKE